MKNPIINNLIKQFENIKEEFNKNKLPTISKLDAETLLNVTNKIKDEYTLAKANKELIEELDVLANQISHYIQDLEGLLENESTSSL